RDRGGDATRRFFNWFCWSSNLGATFSLLLVALVQQNVGFLASYLIPVACLALALLIFLLGEAEDPLPNSRAQPGAPSLQEDLTNFQVLTWILPVLLTFIPYWLVYLHMQSMYYLQGLQLSIPSTFQHGQDHTSTLQGYMFPGAWLPLANTALLLALVPLKDLILDPFLARHKLLPSPLKQMTLGMFFSLTSLLTAGLLEGQRLHHMEYLLLGMGEIFTSIPSLEFVYAEAPKAMKGATMGLFFFLSGVGWLLGWGLWTLLSL
ncbi:PREDICTED: solute carrier family 15 member 3-like, partial [Merops nubicus]|uniref:solute carrier family 15 member 3-like n=1 Tax=Merops nubicus TaxID=57421 RepID=UPI0004F0208E